MKTGKLIISSIVLGLIGVACAGQPTEPPATPDVPSAGPPPAEAPPAASATPAPAPAEAAAGAWDGRVCWVMIPAMIRAGRLNDYAGRATEISRGESSLTSEPS